MGYLERARVLMQEEGLSDRNNPAMPREIAQGGIECEISETREISQGTQTVIEDNLRKALAEKKGRLALRKRDLTSPYYGHTDEWTKRQITHLQAHIAEIQRYLREGGDLKLPRCCWPFGYICLIAMTGFDACIMTPEECGFSLRLQQEV